VSHPETAVTGPRRLLPSVAFALLLSSPAAAVNFVSDFTMTQDEETPPTGSTAIGSGHIVLDTLANSLAYNITYSGLEGVETGAHIHGAADPGQIGLPRLFLPAGPSKQGVWNYPASFESDLLAGRFYVNIHTDVYPEGAIRGQIAPVVTLPGLAGAGAFVAMAAMAGCALSALRRRPSGRNEPCDT
jgi:hypothetical protein